MPRSAVLSRSEGNLKFANREKLALPRGNLKFSFDFDSGKFCNLLLRNFNIFFFSLFSAFSLKPNNIPYR
jgi:hypothetical protein